MLISLPDNPSGEKGQRESRGGFVVEIGDNLWDFCYSPAKQSRYSQTKRDFIVEVTETVFEPLLDPSYTRFSLNWAVVIRNVNFHHFNYYYFSFQFSFNQKGEQLLLTTSFGRTTRLFITGRCVEHCESGTQTYIISVWM